MKALAALTVLVAVIYVGSCCTFTNEEKYCSSRFVALVRVDSDLIKTHEQSNGQFYKISMIKSYKNNSITINKKRVYTSNIRGMCGVVLEKGKRYLISGNMDMHIDICSSLIEQVPLSPSTTQLLKSPPTCRT